MFGEKKKFGGKMLVTKIGEKSCEQKFMGENKNVVKKNFVSLAHHLELVHRKAEMQNAMPQDHRMPHGNSYHFPIIMSPSRGSSSQGK